MSLAIPTAGQQLASPPVSALPHDMRVNQIQEGSNDRDSTSSKTRACRYFSRTGSCRAGSQCPFSHDETQLPGARVGASTNKDMSEASGSKVVALPQDRRQAITQPFASRVVAKPIPQAQTQDPREFQLGQVRRRFSPKETKQTSAQPGGEGTLLKFTLAPSDPDFPFEITALECLLTVPIGYPNDRPTLRVGNRDIPRGFALNVEYGFDNLAEERPDSSLLELMKALDKSLEVFLSAPKAETIKLVANKKDTRHLASQPSRSVEPAAAIKTQDEELAVLEDKLESPSPTKPVEYFTAQQKTEALKRRAAEVRQLEARMGRLPLYKKSSDGIAYTLPIEPKRRADLPVSLQAVKAIQLFVPMLYPLQPCRIQIEGVDPGDTKSLEKGFENIVIEKSSSSLMGHVNYLAQNMHNLAKTSLEQKRPAIVVRPTPSVEKSPSISAQGKAPEGLQDPERSHIQYITRPPEWTIVNAEDAEDNTDTDDLYSYDSDESTSDEEGGAEVKTGDEPGASQPPSNPEHGTAISFPFIELYGIELLEVTTLNITVKCGRCKETTEIKGLKNGVTKTETCRKCASPLVIGFRRDLIHAHAVRAGFLDLEGCNVGDMLLSTFTPTCSQCSTAFPSPGIVSVQGETTTNVCRECHQKITFKIPSVKFLRITHSHLPSALPPRRKKETLGLTPGTELPKRGRCRHYSKSYRWFRFSCCQKVYACDKCHDEEEEHPNERANRMICGWCSREQNYRPEECAVCHGYLMKRKGTGGFWEGGKGTRDKVKMSRKDKRKHRRIGGPAKPKVVKGEANDAKGGKKVV